MDRNTFKLLGFKVDTFGLKNSVESAVDYAKFLINSKQGAQVVTINPEMIEYALKVPEFAQLLNSAELVLPDGIGIQIALKIKGICAKRIAGIEFAYKLLQESAKEGFSVALVGAKPNIIEKAVKNLSSEISGLNVVYFHDGYFKNDDEIFWALGEKNPQIVLVALGSPRQEMFIKKYRKHHPQTLMVGVGGSFDVWSGEIKRAPKIYQRLGLEWLYRTVKEPSRFKRIFPTLPKFILRVILSEKPKG